MGLLDGGRSYSASDAYLAPKHISGSHSRGVSPARSTRSSKSQGYFVKPSSHSHSHSHSYSSPRPGYARSPSGSFFGGGTSKGYGNSSWLGGGSRGIFGGSGTSSYRRRPRDGYISYLIHKLQRMIKDLWYYARRHPVKAFFAIIVPLLSAGGAIHGLLRQFGVKMPFGLDGATRHGGGGYYDSRGYGGSSSGGGGLMNSLGGVGGLMSVAKAFM